jgi:hypothetical protein
VVSTIPVRDGPRPPWLDRAVAAMVVAIAAPCTVLLLRATPDPRGYDTHVQLGLPSCSWPRMYGIPCPTCGATTAACYVVHGHPIAALIAHPFGAAVAAGGLLLAAAALGCLLRGRSFLDLLRQLPLGRLLIGAVVLLLLSWLYKYLAFTPP